MTTEEIETWKDILGYEGTYQVSSYGRVKGNTILKPDFVKGYHRVTLCKNGVHTRFMCHRLVAIAFIPNPNEKPCVNHINGIKTNNYAENLEWVTHSENSLHAARTGLMPPTKPMLGKRGDLNVRSKMVMQIDSAGNSKIWSSVCVAADSLNIHQANITAVCNGRRINAGGYKWSYSI